jgi:hypothetical protein
MQTSLCCSILSLLFRPATAVSVLLLLSLTSTVYPHTTLSVSSKLDKASVAVFLATVLTRSVCHQQQQQQQQQQQ